MSGYLAIVKEKVEFDGDVISVEMKPMTRADYGKVTPFLKADEDGTIKMSFEDQSAFIDATAGILADCITSFNGLEDASGNAINLSIALSDAYFNELVTELFNLLMKASGLTKDDEKN